MRLRRQRILRAFLAASAAVAALVVGPGSGSANNDLHRIFEPAGPFDLPAGYCAFPVHLDFPADREYGTLTTLPDGSTVIETTGSLMVTASNEANGKSVQINAGGPGTITIPPTGTPIVYDLRGRSLLIGTNLTAFGLPSNVVAGAGPAHFVEATNGLGGLPFGATISASGAPQVLMDVCAALA